MSSVSDAVARVRARGAGVAKRLLGVASRRAPRRRRRLRPPPTAGPRRRSRRTRAGRWSSGWNAVAGWTTRSSTRCAPWSPTARPVARWRSPSRCSAIPPRARSDVWRRASSPTNAATSRSREPTCATCRRTPGRDSRRQSTCAPASRWLPTRRWRPSGRWWTTTRRACGPRAGTRSSPPSSDTGPRSSPARSSPSSTGTSTGTCRAGRKDRCTATGCGRGSRPTPTRPPVPRRRTGAPCSRSWTTGIRVRTGRRPTSAITSRASPGSRTSRAIAACASTARTSWSVCSRRFATGRGRSSGATISTPTSR